MKRTMVLLSVVCLWLQIPSGADLISYYDFEEPNPFDDKITGAVATVGANVTLESDTPLGNAGAFPDGTATDNDVRVAQADAPVIGSSDFTCMVWVKRTDGSSSTADGITDMVANTDEGGFQLLFAPVDLFTLGVGGPGGQWLVHRATSPVADTAWHHLAVSVDRDNPSGVLMYIDGVLNITLDATPFESVFMAANQDYQIGSTNDFSLNGLMDELAIFDTALTVEEIRKAMKGIGSPPELAANPIPDDTATDVPRDVVLSWTPGEYAVTHDVYLGTSFDDVNDASRTNAMDVLVSQGQADAAYDAGRLEFGQTYYWRVDEVNGAPDNTIFKGNVWSFAVEPFSYPITDVTATSNGTSEEGTGPENTVNGSGLNAEGQHSTESSDMWLARPADGEPLQIEYAFDAVYKLDEMLVWNYNVQFELLLGFGVKNATIEYSENGTDWSVLGDFDLNQATATETYTANTTIDFGGVAAQYVRLTVNSGFGSMGQYGLSEVRFMYIAVQAREPEPADEATDVSVATALTWRAGREAAVHEVYLGTDAETLPLAATVDAATYTPGPLDLDTTYYWQIVEVNEAEAISAWAGSIWSFATQAYLVVDDFESYEDDNEDLRIYNVWIDGWTNDTGSTVGHFEAPFAETTIVHSGNQSMPLYYDNTSASVSEADLMLSQNWTTSGIKSLGLFFYGEPDNTGQLYVKINGTKVAYDGAAEDIAEPSWQPWNIDLSTLGVNLSNVTELTIGIEGSGATGLLYIDDVRLYSGTP